MSDLNREEIDIFLSTVKGWSFDNNALKKTFSFKNYYKTMIFVNTVAEIAHNANHHPEMLVSYNSCEVSYTTHSPSPQRVTQRDITCIRAIETKALLLK